MMPILNRTKINKKLFFSGWLDLLRRYYEYTLQITPNDELKFKQQAAAAAM